MSISTHAEEQDKVTVSVAVFGLTRERTARRLALACASIPCLPLIIFKIDRLGRLLGVVDAMNKGRIYYVSVHHWGRDGKPDMLPTIGWTRDPGDLHPRMRKKAERLLIDCVSGVRKGGLKLQMTLAEHADVNARMALAAS